METKRKSEEEDVAVVEPPSTRQVSTGSTKDWNREEQRWNRPENSSEPKVTSEEDMVRFPSMMRFPSMHFLGPEDALAEPAPRNAVECMKLPVDEITAVSQSYKTFGLHRQGDVWIFREWLPQAEAAFLVGEFNDWNTEASPLHKDERLDGVWSCEIASPQSEKLRQGQKYKVFVKASDGKCSYVTPAWATKMVYTPDVRVLDAVVWPVQAKAPQKEVPLVGDSELIYECHLGLAHRPGQPKSWSEAAEVVIPRAARNGYTALLLVGAQECQNYSEMGVRPCVYFAPASCLGEPEELQEFVAKAHSAGLRVYMTVSHDGACWSNDGLSDHYFRGGCEPVDPVNGARIFDYDSKEVVRYLSSSLSFWMNEYGFDGFKFSNVSSMIYTRRGRWLPKDPTEFEEYVKKPGMVDESAVQYLRMANAVVHEQGKLLGKTSTTIAEDSSLFPELCGAVEEGGLGFDICQTDHVATQLRKMLRLRDEDWSVGEFVTNVVPGRDIPVLASTESSRECVVSRKPLKIAMLAWETLHTIAVGGVAPHVTELAGALHGAGHEVHIFTRAQGPNMDHEILGVHYHEVNYDQHGCMVQDVRNMCGAFVAALNGHEHVWGAFDIVHGHDWLAGPGIQQLKGQGKNCVFTMHSTEGGRNGDMGKGHPGIKEIERCACGAADKLISVSGVLAEEVRNVCGADGGKMKVIYNGIHAGPIVNMEWHDEWTGNTKKDKGWNPMDPMFLFVGRHTAQKGCDIFIEAIPHILSCRGDAKFVIVGDGHLKAHNESRAHALGVAHAICFTGSLKSGSAHLKALFRACDAVVVPSRNEPFGIVVLEAWASGKPVVATTSGGPRDFVKPDEDGYLVSPDSGSVAWGCCKILENFDHAKWMGRNAQAKAMREFGWEKIARDTENVYYELLNLHDAPRSNNTFAGYSMANALLRERCFNMSIADSDPSIARGLSILKVTKLLTASLFGRSVMTWMGNEFAQIDLADMPRLGNGFNDECSRVKYELADNEDLKFGRIAAFEARLNTLAARYKWLACPKHEMLMQCEEAKVLAYARGTCVFVFNLHPTKDLDNCAISIPAALVGGPLACVLNTDEVQFAGLTSSPVVIVADQKERGSLRINLRSRSAAIIAPADMQMGA